MTDLNSLPDDIKQAFNYFIKRVGELELSSFLLQNEIGNLIKLFETLKNQHEIEKLNWQSLENKYLENIKNCEDQVNKLKNKKIKE